MIKTQLEWRIYLTILINFISSKYPDETRIMYSRSDNIKIILNNIKIMCIETDEIIEELFESLLQRYQEGLEELMAGSEFIFDSVNILH